MRVTLAVVAAGFEACGAVGHVATLAADQKTLGPFHSSCVPDQASRSTLAVDSHFSITTVRTEPSSRGITARTTYQFVIPLTAGENVVSTHPLDERRIATSSGVQVIRAVGSLDGRRSSAAVV